MTKTKEITYEELDQLQSVAARALAMLDDDNEIDDMRLDDDDIREGFPIEAYAKAVFGLRELRDTCWAAKNAQEARPPVHLTLIHAMPYTRVVINIAPYLGMSPGGNTLDIEIADFEAMRAEQEGEYFEEETAEMVARDLSFVAAPVRRFFDEKARYAEALGTDDALTWYARFEPKEVEAYVNR